MKRPVLRMLLSLGAIGIAASATAQSLGEVAAREKERRAKEKSDKPVKSYRAEDLANTKGGTFTQMEGPAASASPAPATAAPMRSPVSSNAPSSEAGWRSRAQQARARVARLEAEVQDLDAKATRSAYGSSNEQCHMREGMIEDGDRKRFEECLERSKDDPARHQAERVRLLDSLARARRELAQAKRDLEQLEEDARHASVPPGWLRE